MPLADAERVQSHETIKRSAGIGWLPIAVLPALAVGFRNALPPWAFMWLLAFAIYFSLKWQTWWEARTKIAHSVWRSVGYLLAWPGMDAASFLDERSPATKASTHKLLWAIAKTGFGVILLWVVAHSLPATEPLLRGWVGMVGLIMLLHFGAFDIVAFIWQHLGVNAQPIMSAPLRSTALGEFWGKRWNLGFRQLAHQLVFLPLYRHIGVGAASFLVFVLSGLIHDFIISLPARAGYGLPTAYFVLQGVGISIERSSIGRHIGFGRGVSGWIFMAVVTVGPAYWLFHPWFVMRVILPFMKAIHAL